MTLMRSCENPLMLRDFICFKVGLAVHILPQNKEVHYGLHFIICLTGYFTPGGEVVQALTFFIAKKVKSIYGFNILDRAALSMMPYAK